MKKESFIQASFLMTMMLIITFNFSDAKSASRPETSAAIALQSPQPPTVQFMISIPEDYASRIVRENGDNACYFRFKKTDGTFEFLFQVNKVSEIQWLSIKDQLNSPTILDHKNGFIYYAQVTDKDHIKGADNAAYSQVYKQLHQLINTIVITEGEQQ